MSDDERRKDVALPIMIMDILDNVLGRADKPIDVSDFLTYELRELTGARCILVVQFLHAAGEKAFRVVSVNPARRRQWSEAPQLDHLYEIAQRLFDVQVWRADDASDVGDFLRREGLGLSVAVPLRVGAADHGQANVGSVLVLGLPGETHLGSLIDLFKSLAAILAIVLRNAFLYERQEEIIAERTSQLQLANEGLQESQRKVLALLEEAERSRDLLLSILEDERSAQEALAKSSTFTSTILNTTRAMILVIDNEGRIAQFNRECEEISGYSAAEAIGREPREFLLLPEESAGVTETLCVARTGPNPTFHENYWVTRDGRLRRLSWVNAAIRDEEGHPQYIVCTAIDITEKKAAEDALRQNEAMLSTILNSLPQSIFWKDKQGVYLGCNRIFAEAVGFTRPEALVGRTDFDLHYPRESAEAYRADDQEVLRTRTSRNHVIEPSQALDGTQRWIDITKVPLEDAEGNAYAVLGVCEDVTERKRTEDALRESESRYRLLYESMMDAFVYYGIDGRIREFNEVYRQMLGYEPDELRELTCEDITPTKWRAIQAEIITEQTLVRGYSDLFEIEYIRKDGTVFPVELRLYRVCDEENKQVGLWGIVRDITGRKRTEEELARHREHLEELVESRTRELAESNRAMQTAKDSAEAANRAKSIFLANMSHELRTPLNAVLGFSQIMRSDSSLSEEQRETLDIINRSGTHLLGLINDVLDMSKIEAGQVARNDIVFDLWADLQTITEMMRMRASAKGLAFSLERAPDVPRHVKADQKKLKQILINLVGNAVKFTATGSIVLRLAVKSDARVLCGEVEDTGPGIANDQIARLFEPFVQGRETIEGVGLGLFISRKLVELMGGRITVQSAPGEGSRFRIEIPFHPAVPDEIALLAPQARVGRLAPGQSPACVLVAEDSKVNRLLMVKTLEAAGFEVIEAANGEDAVNIFAKRKPDIVLMDIRMPVMDGDEATRRIKATEAGKSTPVIIVSASALDDDRQKVLSSGADDFIGKPIQTEELFGKIRMYLGVEYVYQKEPQKIADVVDLPSLYASVEELPGELRGRLNLAVSSLDLNRFRRQLPEVSSINPELAERLAGLAKGYEITALARIFRTKGTP